MATAVEQDSPDFNVDTVKLYLQEEGFSAFTRIRSKILGTGEAAYSAAGKLIAHVQGPCADSMLCCCLVILFAAGATAVGTALWATATNR